jgi:hypothetical protein
MAERPRSPDAAIGPEIRFLRGNVATSGVLADHIESVTVNPSVSHQAAPDARSHGTSKRGTHPTNA